MTNRYLPVDKLYNPLTQIFTKTTSQFQHLDTLLDHILSFIACFLKGANAHNGRLEVQ